MTNQPTDMTADAILRDALLFIEELPLDLGRGSLNGLRVQVPHAIRAYLADKQAAPPVAQPQQRLDEREAFEAWAYTKGWRNFTRHEFSGNYLVEGDLELRWIGWQARAALAERDAPPAAQPDSAISELIDAAMTLEREQGANAGMDASHPAWQRLKLAQQRVLTAQVEPVPLKDRPDFIAGYDAGLADGKRCAERDAPPASQPEWSDAKLRGIASNYFHEATHWPAAMLCLRHLLMEQAKYPSAQVEPAPAQPALPDGMRSVPCAAQLDPQHPQHGWLFIPHVDGQWVSAFKLVPFSQKIIEYWLAAAAQEPKRMVAARKQGEPT